MSTWFTSDSHFGHAGALTFPEGARPFATIDDHDAALIEAWNARVRPSDTVVHLGDVAWKEPDLLRCVPQLNGHLILVAGNHDTCWTRRWKSGAVAKAHRKIDVYRQAGFARVVDSGAIVGSAGGHRVILSHLPAVGDHTREDRYAGRRPAPGGLPIICGHVHHQWRTSGPQINVGVDQWAWGPVHEDEVVDLLAHLPSWDETTLVAA